MLHNDELIYQIGYWTSAFKKLKLNINLQTIISNLTNLIVEKLRFSQI